MPRYACLAAIVLAVMTLHTLNQQWAGDFWEHAAVVRELAARPWAPRHPLFAIDAPHPFFSPYSLTVALIARAGGIESPIALGAAGLVNLLLFLIAFRAFATSIIGAAGAFYGLLFTLVLWGLDPFRYSGFLHLNALGFVMAYPSVFAMALTMVALFALIRFTRDSQWRWGVLVAAVAPVVLVTHPITAVVLAAGLVAFSIRPAIREPARFAMLAGIVAATSLAGALLWPYYPWLTLIASGSETYAAPNLGIYEGVLQRTWPALAGLPFVVRRLLRDKFDGLALFTISLLLLYVVGWVIQNGPLGRVLAGAVLGLHLALADAVARLEAFDSDEPRVAQAKAASSRARRRALHAGIAIVTVAGVLNAMPALVRAVPRGLLPARFAQDPRLDRMIDVYRPLAGRVAQDAVVMADVNVSRHVPAFAGKVVGFIDPEAFVPDQTERREAVYRFFTDISSAERRAILDAYRAVFIVFDTKQSPLTPTARAALADLGEVSYEDGRLLLLRVASADER